MNIKSLSTALLAGAFSANISFAHATFNMPASPDRHKATIAHLLLASDSGQTKSHDAMKMAVYKIGSLEIHDPFARATPPNAPVSGGYLIIKNTGSNPDRLLGGSADFAAMVEVHEMKMDGEVMKMRKLASGLEIPAGGEVVLKPGGFHLMFMKLADRLMAGEMRKVTLTFEKAGVIEMDFPVREIGSSRGKMDHSKHGETD